MRISDVVEVRWILSISSGFAAYGIRHVWRINGITRHYTPFVTDNTGRLGKSQFPLKRGPHLGRNTKSLAALGRNALERRESSFLPYPIIASRYLATTALRADAESRMNSTTFALPPAVQAVIDAYDLSHPVPQDDVGAEQQYVAKVAWLRTQETALLGLVEGAGARCWRQGRGGGECDQRLRLCTYGNTLLVSCQAHQPDDGSA